MTNPNTIRIGSWLFGSDKSKKQVTPQTIAYAIRSFESKDVMPIPLKEEMLMKITPMIPAPGDKIAFHFTNGAWIVRLLKVDYYWSVHLTYSAAAVGVPFFPHLKDIEYVHELQNILLEILGIEVEIEP